MPKRTRRESQDINQFAASVVKQTIEATEPAPDQATISQLMRAMGRRGGIKGAATLNARLSPAHRKKSAQRAALAPVGEEAPVKKEERTSETLRLWLQRPEDKRTDNDVLAFYGWLAQNRAELLDSWRYGDPYQGLKVTLRGHIREPR